jgi:hypothetical protein
MLEIIGAVVGLLVFIAFGISYLGSGLLFARDVTILGFSKMAGFTTPPHVLPAEAVQKILEEQRQDVASETRSNHQG